jgi:hypothetical protein
MEQLPINLNTVIFVGVDSHPSEHTAVAINRFEEEKGVLRFENTNSHTRHACTDPASGRIARPYRLPSMHRCPLKPASSSSTGPQSLDANVVA